MNRTRTLVCLIGSALLVATALAQDDLPEWPEREIEFEILDEPLELTDFTGRPGQIWPRFAVSYTVDDVPGFHAWSREDHRKTNQQLGIERLLSTSLAKNLSEQQREFVQSSAWVQRRSIPPGTLEGYSRGATRCTLYAVTEQDARLMAEATLEMHDARRRAAFEESKGWLLKYRARMAEAEEELPEAERKALEARETYESAQKAAPHKNREAAQEDLERLELSLWSIEVNVTGINAKIAAIRRLKGEKDATGYLESLKMLDRLLMEQDIELAGLLAQKAVIESRLDLAKACVSAGRRYDEAVERIEKLKDTIKSTRQNLERTDSKLRNLDSSRWPVRLFGNVVIQPIKHPGE
jgi:prefoldin subunit 5